MFALLFVFVLVDGFLLVLVLVFLLLLDAVVVVSSFFCSSSIVNSKEVEIPLTVTVMVTFPAFIAVTFPSSDTVAIVSSLELQVISNFSRSMSSGCISSVKASSSPTLIVFFSELILSSEIDTSSSIHFAIKLMFSVTFVVKSNCSSCLSA